jgi:hypothetical protein
MQLRHGPSPLASAGFALGLAAALAGCSMQVPTTEPANGARSQQPGPASPNSTADATSAALDAVFGRWRRTPAHATPDMTAAAESACRDDAAVRDLPLIVVDARGEGEVTLVFAGATQAAVCHAALTRGRAATADARGIQADTAAPPASKKLGAHDLEIVDSTVGARSVLVGRVGPDVARVSAQFDDATWSNASMAGGWYAMWWPGRDPALTVAAVDGRSEAVDGFAP